MGSWDEETDGSTRRMCKDGAMARELVRVLCMCCRHVHVGFASRKQPCDWLMSRRLPSVLSLRALRKNRIDSILACVAFFVCVP